MEREMAWARKFGGMEEFTLGSLKMESFTDLEFPLLFMTLLTLVNGMKAKLVEKERS